MKNVTWSHGINDLNWKCPVCQTKIIDLIHTRKNGITYNGVQEHHLGRNPKEDYESYLEGETILICYKCNIRETKWRKEMGKKEALNLEQMRMMFK